MQITAVFDGGKGGVRASRPVVVHKSPHAAVATAASGAVSTARDGNE
jgi:hypothetical protein